MPLYPKEPYLYRPVINGQELPYVIVAPSQAQAASVVSMRRLTAREAFEAGVECHARIEVGGEEGEGGDDDDVQAVHPLLTGVVGADPEASSPDFKYPEPAALPPLAAALETPAVAP